METPYENLGPFWADEFRRGASYRNWRTRGTPDWLLIFTVAGAGRLHSGGAEISAKAGSVIAFEPGALQSYSTDSEAGVWHILWSHFLPRPHWTPWLRWPDYDQGLMRVQLPGGTVQRAVRSAMEDSVRLCRRQLLDLGINALERALLWIHSFQAERVLDERIRTAAAFMTETVRQPLTLAQLARRCGLSVSRFSHLFREQMGMSPQHYMEELRLARAAQFLRSTSLTISEISAETGYANAFYFSNRFKRRFADSPSAYRRRSPGNP